MVKKITNRTPTRGFVIFDRCGAERGWENWMFSCGGRQRATANVGKPWVS